MSAQIAELLLGLYFVGVSFPGLFATGEEKVARSTVFQFIFGIVLCLLAFLNIGLIGVVAQAASPAPIVVQQAAPAK